MSIPLSAYLPTSDLVAVAWLRQRVPLLDAGSVATALPSDASLWAEAGFVTARAVTGIPDIDTFTRRPIVQVDCWAVGMDAAGNVTTKPPWNKAARLAELIRNATEDVQAYGRPVELPAAYLPARVQAAYLYSEPSKVTDDPSGYARITFDMALDWTRAAA
tara:strand:- start:998 stop:1480 length:483 start_codon:yes stop_codon:yes gene_type:complete